MAKKIEPAQMRTLHAMLNELGLMDMKREIISSHTEGRTDSARELSVAEANAIIASLAEEKAGKVEPMRKKIIHLLCLMGYVQEGKPNMRRINYFVQNRTGARNPQKKPLHLLTVEETRQVLNQVVVMHKKEMERHGVDAAN
jgi:hypothetical protein